MASLGLTARTAVGTNPRVLDTTPQIRSTTLFEDESPGEFPDGWIKLGNETQSVELVSPTFSGDQAFMMEGTPGGCWEAIAAHSLEVPSAEGERLRITGAFGPTGTGDEGCHDGHADMKLRTAAESWDAGSSTPLFTTETTSGDTTKVIAADGTTLTTLAFEDD